MARTSALTAGMRYKALGAAFLALLLFFVWLTYAIFSKKFTDYADVELQSSKIGLQLPARADVKIRGVIVGVVRDVSVSRTGATLRLGLYPSQLSTIPANVSAKIVPKTLFGEKYVALQLPEQPSSHDLAAGDVIKETEVDIEVEKVLSDIYPLLRTVQPAELNYTLNALATALEGRGDALGENLVTLDDYLTRINPKIPALVDDLTLLGEVSDTYRSVVPELANFLRNSVTTGNTFVAKERKIQALFDDVASFSSTSRDFLQQNGDNIIRLSRLGQQELPLFARYAPNYPCFLKGIVKAIPMEESAFRGHMLHINLELLPKQPRGYGPQDQPRFDDHRGPTAICQQYLPDNNFSQENLPPGTLAPEIRDGVQYDAAFSKGRAATGFDVSSGYAGTQVERDVVNALVAPVLGVPTDRVPDVASLLFAPLARGTQVSVR